MASFPIRRSFRLLALLLAASCSPQEEPPNAGEPVPAAYVAAAEALAFDDYERARNALSDLAGESRGDLKARAQAAAASPDIAAMRSAFGELSELVVDMKLPPGHSLIFCPMFEKGSYWVQQRRIPINPYMGQAMLSCGDIVRVEPAPDAP